MGLELVVSRLGKVIVVLIAAGIAYGCVGVVLALLPGVELVPEQSFPWPEAMPAWPLVALLAVALVFTAAQAPFIVMLRARKRTRAERLRAEADGWLHGPAAGAARASGLTLLRPSAFRVRDLGPHDVALSWNPPLDDAGAIVVYRSPLGFATSAEAGDDQVLIYSGDEAACEDAGLDDGCVYHYTAFARSRGGGWSTPAWAWVATPALPLNARFLGSLRMNRIFVPGSPR